MEERVTCLPSVCGRLISIAAYDPRRAVRLARQAVARTSNDDHLMYAWANYTLGWTLVQWEQLPDAATVLQQAYQLFAHVQQPVPMLHCRHALLLIAMIDGTSTLQLADWDTLAADYATYECALDVARVRISQVLHLNRLGRAQEALEVACQIEPLIQQGTYADQGRLHRVMAFAYGDTGALPQAHDHIAAALRCFTHLRARIEIAKCRVERSWILQRSEEFHVAQHDLDQARAIFQQCGMPLRVAVCDRDRGLIASRLGRYDQAMTTTLHARAHFLTLGRQAEAAICDINLGIIAHYSGLFDLARAAYQRALIVYRQHGIQRLQAVCQRNQALVLLAQNKPAAALQQLAVAEEMLQTLGENMELTEVLLARAAALHHLHQSTAAWQTLDRAYILFTTLGNIPATAKCQLEQAWLYLDHALPVAAQRCLNEARTILADRPMYAWRIAYGDGRCAEAQGQPEVALAHYQAACAIVSRLRQQLASEHASSGQFIQAHAPFSAALRLAASQNDPATILLLAEQQRDLALQRQIAGGSFHMPTDLQARYASLRTELQTVLEQSARGRTDGSDDRLNATLERYTDLLLQARHHLPLPDPDPDIQIDLDDLRQHLTHAFPDGWVVLVYVWCDSELLIVMLTTQDLTLTRRPLDATMQRLLEHACMPHYRPFTYLDMPFAQGQARTPWSDLVDLGEILLPAELRTHLHATMRLLIVPGDILHALPWAALRVGDDWLCTQAVIQMLPGIRAWFTLAARVPGSTAALLVGCSQFGGRAPDLPAVSASLDLVETAWPGQVTRLEQTAALYNTVQTLATTGALAQYGMLFFATHAQMIASRGLFAHVKLSDDDLFLDEVARLGLKGALVVLATCDGAVSHVLPGEEVMSLSRAFLIAGARDVIASLWQVYDHAILGILTPLYAALAEGADAPTAVALAQRTHIAQYVTNDSGSIAASPLVWANLAVIGAGTPWTSAGGTKPTVCHTVPA